MVPSERTVAVAIGHGKKAARNIDAYLRGDHVNPAGQARTGPVRCLEYLVLRRRAARTASSTLRHTARRSANTVSPPAAGTSIARSTAPRGGTGRKPWSTCQIFSVGGASVS
jgi:hypothetical protein